MDKIKPGLLFGYVQHDIKVPEHPREHFPISKKRNVCKQDVGPLTPEYAEKERLISEPRRLLNSSSEKTNGIISTQLLLFLLELGLVHTNFCFVEYTLVKCFNNFVQSTVNARRQEMRMQTPVLSQKLWSCLQTARTITNFKIAVAFQLQGT